MTFDEWWEKSWGETFKGSHLSEVEDKIQNIARLAWERGRIQLAREVVDITEKENAR